MSAVPKATPPRLNDVLLVDDTDREIRAYASPTFYYFNPVITEPGIETTRFELKTVMF